MSREILVLALSLWVAICVLFAVLLMVGGAW